MDTLYSKILKTGLITYFMDIKEAKNNKKYLTVTASQPSKEGDGKFAKRSVTIFSSVADDFINTLREAKTAVDSGEDFSRKIKSGKINYFVDVKEAKNNTRYVSITESQPSKDDPKKFSKRSIMIFNKSANDFVNAFEEVIDHLK